MGFVPYGVLPTGYIVNLKEVEMEEMDIESVILSPGFENKDALQLQVARYNESHRKDFLPSHIIDEAKRTGYYKKMETYSVFEGMRYVEDQMTGIGHIEGKLEGGVIGYFAYIEMWSGFTATIYIPIDQVKPRGNPESYALSMLIKTKGLQNYVKPDRSG
jgi:hypothetical protein